MKEFIADLSKLCKKHKITLDGQLLVLPENHPQEITHSDQAYWGNFKVRDMAALVFKPILPERKVEKTALGKKIYVQSDIAGYTCPVTDVWVDGKSAHRENLKRTGCRILEPGERENFIKEKPKEMERSAEKAADFLSDRIAERWNS